MHDGVGQLLTALAMTARRLAETDDVSDAVRSEARGIQDIVTDTHRRIRAITRGLVPEEVLAEELDVAGRGGETNAEIAAGDGPAIGTAVGSVRGRLVGGWSGRQPRRADEDDRERGREQDDVADEGKDHPLSGRGRPAEAAAIDDEALAESPGDSGGKRGEE